MTPPKIPSPKPAWFMPLMLYAHGLGKRPADAPKPAPAWFKYLLDEFNAWNAWKDTGGPKPTGLPAKTTQWAWSLRGFILKHRHPLPPPVPPKPPPSWTDTRPLIFTAWEPGLARPGPWTVARITIPGIAPVWQVDGVGYIAQAEDAGQAEGAVEFLKSVEGRGQRAIVATQSGWADVEPFLEIGVNTCFVEAYGPEGWPPLSTMMWQAEHDGWPYTIPCVGCYHGYRLNNYDLSPYGQRFSIWVAELMGDEDWQQLAAMI